MTVYRNDDGLETRFGTEQANVALTGVAQSEGIKLKAFVELEFGRLTSTLATDTRVNDFASVMLPTGAIITKATLDVTTAFTSGGAATLTIGLLEEDGTVIDSDGIDAAIALTAIDAVGDQIACDGALVGGAALTADGYVSVNIGTAAYTAGKAILEIEYLKVV